VRRNTQATDKLRLVTFTADFGTLAAVLFAQTPQARIVQLSPAAIPGVPANVVKELERRGCTIPQEAPTKKSSNVIKGEFAKPGQTDWAALCSVNGVSTILVFWNGSEKNPAAIAPKEDRIYIQGFKKDQFWYSRAEASCAGSLPTFSLYDVAGFHKRFQSLQLFQQCGSHCRGDRFASAIHVTSDDIR